MIHTDSLGKVYAGKVALESLSMRVQPGEILGFLGPNGAGKSTTVKILTGMIKPSSGSAQVAGFDIVSSPLEVKRRIGFVPEAGALYEPLACVANCLCDPTLASPGKPASRPSSSRRSAPARRRPSSASRNVSSTTS